MEQKKKFGQQFREKFVGSVKLHELHNFIQALAWNSVRYWTSHPSLYLSWSISLFKDDLGRGNIVTLDKTPDPTELGYTLLGNVVTPFVVFS